MPSQVGNKGDFCWDLKGHYGNLEAVLKDAEYAIRVSPHVPLSIPPVDVWNVPWNLERREVWADGHPPPAGQTITLSPFNGVFFYVLFVDGTEHFSAGELGWDLRRVA